MKTLKIVFVMILLSLFVTSCTDLNSDNDNFAIDHIENTKADTGGGTGGCSKTEC